MNDLTDQFKSAMAEQGLSAPVIIADGEIHRFSTSQNKRDDAGWYILYDDTIPSGCFGDWRTGAFHTFRANIRRELTPNEKTDYANRVAAMQQMRDDEKLRVQAETAIRSQKVWAEAKESCQHPYLVKKQIKACGARQTGDNLIIPIRIDGVITSLQLIDQTGSKKFMPGGKVLGGFFSIGRVNKTYPIVCIAEGYATGASIHEATGLPVAVAFSCGNLLSVGLAIRALFPTARLIYCADDDYRTAGNPGLTRAKEAAQATKGSVVTPLFTENQSAGTDFNDLAQLEGLVSVKNIIMPKTEIEPARQERKITKLSEVEPQKISWLWWPKIARGKLTLLIGDPGVGKSLVTVSMAAHVSQGRIWPDGEYCPAGSVIFISCEDDPGDTIRPRLDACQADPSKVYIIDMVEGLDGRPRPFTLADTGALEDIINQVGDVRLIIIDPVSAYLGGTDSHKNADVRGLLAPISALAMKHKVAVLAINHLNKGAGSPIYRAMGSLAFVAAARAAWAVVKDKNNPTRRLFVPIKNNIGDSVKGMAYRIGHGENKSPRVEWESEPITMRVEDLFPRGKGESGEG